MSAPLNITACSVRLQQDPARGLGRVADVTLRLEGVRPRADAALAWMPERPPAEVAAALLRWLQPEPEPEPPRCAALCAPDAPDAAQELGFHLNRLKQQLAQLDQLIGKFTVLLDDAKAAGVGSRPTQVEIDLMEVEVESDAQLVRWASDLVKLSGAGNGNFRNGKIDVQRLQDAAAVLTGQATAVYR